jgi:hypothetical protein
LIAKGGLEPPFVFPDPANGMTTSGARIALLVCSRLSAGTPLAALALLRQDEALALTGRVAATFPGAHARMSDALRSLAASTPEAIRPLLRKSGKQ